MMLLRLVRRVATATSVFVLLAAVAFAADTTAKQPPATPASMQWFRDARLGIFIHWGIYSEGKDSESWAFHNGDMPYDEYMAQAKTFTAANYHPEEWAALFKEAGARYAVLTSKHHDGFALWDTHQSKWNAVDASPAGRDLVGPYCAALRHEGLKVGLYFSHLDWSHPDYASVLPLDRANRSKEELSNRWGFPQGPENPAAWERFLAFHRAQLTELSMRYKPDLFWFDGDWERTAEQWHFAELRDYLKRLNPDVILNSRMGGYGDYLTPEQYIPLVAPKGAWEFCVTINDSWGYQRKDHNFKTVRQVVRLLAECAGMGGNMLLDVGPHSDGTLQPEQVAVLKGLGRWTHRHAEALYGTDAGLPAGYFYGASTLNRARDTLYLFCFDTVRDAVAVKGIRNRVRRASIVGGAETSFHKLGGAEWLKMPGVLWVDVPAAAQDPDATVIKLELDGPLDLATAPTREQ